MKTQFPKPNKYVAQLFAALMLCMSASAAQAQVVINEVMASNDTTILDPCGDYSDWIELYNAGGSTVALDGWSIADSGASYIFPSGVSIAGGGYLLVWANDGNAAPPSCPTPTSTNFKLSASGDSVTLSNASSVVQDTVTLPIAVTDESYGRFPNGSGAFERMSTPTPGAINQTSGTTPNPDLAFIVINEAVTSNQTGLQDEDLDYPDWIELYNTSSTVTVNLQGARLQDSSNQWVFPNVSVAPNGFVIVFASGKDRTTPNLHSNFSLSAAGESLSFLNVDLTVEDTVTIPSIAQDNSYARVPNGTGPFTEILSPTPGTTNLSESNPPNPDAINITINEVNSSNFSGLRAQLDNGFYDWIELYNTGGVAVDLVNLRLRDSSRVWSFPQSEILNPGEYIVVFASGENIAYDTGSGFEYHTNFSISSTTGEQITYENADGSLIEVVTVPVMVPDDSYGRNPNGSGPFQTWAVPTPGAANQIVSPPAPNPDAPLIRVNEIQVSNNSTIVDFEGESADWIELYNTSSTVTVDLEDLKIRDSSGGTQGTGSIWVFPAVSMPPNSYLLLFCDGDNLITGELHTNFNLDNGAGETITFLNKDDTVIQTVPVAPNQIPDTSYGAFPNGSVTFQVMNIPTPGALNTDASPSPNPDAGLITINELVTDNETFLLDQNSVAYDIIELYNTSTTTTVNMDGLKLQDSGSVFTFPAGVTMAPDSYLVVFAANGQRVGTELQTNFALESNGETLNFLNTDNTTVETVTIPQLFADQSYARIPNGTGAFSILTNPAEVTPGAANGAGSIIYGDVNDSGNVTSIDASQCACHAVGLITLDAQAQIRADVNGSSTITSIDASQIARFAVGLITCFPVEPGC